MRHQFARHLNLTTHLFPRQVLIENDKTSDRIILFSLIYFFDIRISGHTAATQRHWNNIIINLNKIIYIHHNYPSAEIFSPWRTSLILL